MRECSQNNHFCIIMEHISSRYCLIATITVKFDALKCFRIVGSLLLFSAVLHHVIHCSVWKHLCRRWTPVDTSGHQQRNLTMGHCMLHQYSTTTALCVNTELMKLTMPLVQLINQWLTATLMHFRITPHVCSCLFDFWIHPLNEI